MHVTPLAIWIVVVPTGVIVLLRLCNPPCSWTGTVGPSLPGLTIAPYVDSLLCCRLNLAFLQDAHVMLQVSHEVVVTSAKYFQPLHKSAHAHSTPLILFVLMFVALKANNQVLSKLM
jgi:hypothetical protein